MRALPAREIALTGSEILVCGSGEIIHCADSEITAETAVVNKNGSPLGCGTLSLLPQAAISLGESRISLRSSGRLPASRQAAPAGATCLLRRGGTPPLALISSCGEA